MTWGPASCRAPGHARWASEVASHALIVRAEMGEDIPDPCVNMTVASARGQSMVTVPCTLCPGETVSPRVPVGGRLASWMLVDSFSMMKKV